jgi:hypothetical protein
MKPKPVCVGRCAKYGDCRGEVKLVEVFGGRWCPDDKEWGKFWYCRTAIKEDKKNGFIVKEVTP